MVHDIHTRRRRRRRRRKKEEEAEEAEEEEEEEEEGEEEEEEEEEEKEKEEGLFWHWISRVTITTNSLIQTRVDENWKRNTRHASHDTILTYRRESA